MRKLILFFLLITAFVIAVFFITLRLQKNTEIPPSTPGPEAEALLQKILSAVNQEAWDQLAAVSFSLEPGEGFYFTDLRRGLSELTYREGGKSVVVQFSLDGSKCLVTVAEEVLKPDDARKKCDESIAEEKRARFWLHPFQIIARDSSPSLVGARALLATFPESEKGDGDVYLIVTDEKGLPTHWKTWSPAIPVGGLEVSFEKWIDLQNGARVSTFHRTFINEIEIKDPIGYPVYPEPNAPDRFAGLLSTEAP